ncbi:hypothetical protein RQP46_007569 [Phenoliferia psychrophenolica]
MTLNGSGYTVALRPGTSGGEGQAWAEYSLESVRAWDDERVGQWLLDARCEQHCDLFRRHDIRGNVLFDVDQLALKEMGVKAVGDRVKLVVAIRNLRSRALQATNWLPPPPPPPPTLAPQTPAPAPAPTAPVPTPLAPINGDVPVERKKAAPAGASAATTGAGARGSGRIPPPLHLAQSNAVDLPQAYQPPTSAPRLQPAGPTATSPVGARPLPSPSARIPPPTLPPPRAGTLPQAPAQAPRAPGQQQQRTSGSPGPLDRKPSISSVRPLVSQPISRPSTANSSSASSISSSHRKQASTGRPIISHPYAASASSPTSDAFSTTIYGRNPMPGALASSKTLLPSPAIGKGSPAIEQLGYTGKAGSFVGGRPSTPAGGPVEGSSEWHQDNIKRKTIKLVGDDGVTKIVAVADCVDGDEVLARVLRKFSKKGLGEAEGDEQWGIFTSSIDGQHKLLSSVELHALCLNAQAVERNNLAVRRIPLHLRMPRASKPQRVFGTPSTPDSTRPGGALTSNSSSSSPTSPNYLGVEIPSTTIEPASPSASSVTSSSPSAHSTISPSTPDTPPPPPTPTSAAGLNGGVNPTARTSLASPASERTKMNRASTISVMSGLGGGDWPPSPSNGGGDADLAPSITHSPSFLNPSKKLRNFFGQRPPSELIATHLTEYFPQAEKRLLSKQVRQSMRRSMVRRDSQFSVMSNGTSWEKQAPGGLDKRDSLSPAALSRFSGSSAASGAGGGRNSPLPLTPDDPARLRLSHDSARTVPLLGAPGGDDDTLAQRRLSRMSTASRASRVSSGGWDTASMVTVDEVTAELETRRASMATSGLSEDEEPPEGNRLRPPSIAVGVDEDDEDDYSSSEEDSSDDDEEELAVPLSNASTENKPTLKWIKGALIGAGSFGSVYLGMNPMSGSLMAVKQVELPTGNSHNEERKKSMLDALEREIELLKVLQHENIVQYLDSSSDPTHLNIFLEYVPGGSVAALLSNYGAFEEALVSKFVRQILTGLEYLHAREIIHRDIKGANILVDNKGGIKISDFGISKRVDDNLLSGAKVHRPSLQGSVYWMAPEVVKQTSYTSKADIWSLGCLVVEMLTGAHPWANLTQMQAIFRIGSSSCPAIPDDISPESDEFLQQTFLIDHNQRPSAKDLLQHAFIKDPDALGSGSQQTPTRATFSQNSSPVKEVTA